MMVYCQPTVVVLVNIFISKSSWHTTHINETCMTVRKCCKVVNGLVDSITCANKYKGEFYTFLAMPSSQEILSYFLFTLHQK